ncbi:uncharacterized protein BYT42DRAFT_567453 [Radiomyces spectabilis]|uniref:uncharacterized protein n=1 Tax=Radiomyces spectabilis TaxID=64574 RepID=UPI00221FFD6C|nr:uncharacterized protein BYT42DRAFT_567453 [Radiomyces spectabilis]KAI8379095.1 hypothetical protein BYT42DRAFT_567453 [Radiomyces spectabilis]
MASGTPSTDPMLEDDAYTIGQSLEKELLGKGYRMETPFGSSLAAELQSATATPSPSSPAVSKSPLSDRLPPNALRDTLSSRSSTQSELQKLVVGDPAMAAARPDTDHDARLPRGVSQSLAEEAFSNQTSPILSPLQWSSAMSTSTSFYNRSRRSSFSSTWSSLEVEEDDPFEMLKRQLEELNSAVWETKTLHKRLLNTLLSDESLHLRTMSKTSTSGTANDYAPSLELLITSVITLIERNSRDRERHIYSLRSLDNVIRKESTWMTGDVMKELEILLASMRSTLYDQTYSYENPLPMIRKLSLDTGAMTESLEELKELMYVNKRQVQELNSRLRSIAKTVHEVRKDIRRINKFLEEKDDEDAVVLEKGEVEERLREIMWGLDDLDEKSTLKVKQLQIFWEQAIANAPLENYTVA